jgi:hypothetical protein
MTKSRRTSQFGLVPGSTTALLSAPSKMPGYSWSLPAFKSCPRANGTICKGDEHGGGCYATKGFYALYPAVQRAQNVRFDWTRECLKTSDGRRTWIETLYRAIYKTRTRYFRVHDSGDMFSPAYAAAWVQVMARLERVRFWVPTRAWQIPRANGVFHVVTDSDALYRQLVEMASLPNVTVRPSALNFGEVAPIVKGLHAGTTADCPLPDMSQCPAYWQDNKCGSCRTCWNEKGTEVSYARH